QSTLRGGGSRQRQHQNPSSKGSWLQESRLSVAQGPTHGSYQDRIHRSSESSLKCASLLILVQSRIFKPGLPDAEPIARACYRHVARYPSPKIHPKVSSRPARLQIRVNAESEPRALRRQAELTCVALNCVVKGNAGEARADVPACVR